MTQQEDLEQSLKQVADFLAENMRAPEHYTYSSYEALVLDVGQPFERKPLPRQFRKMTQKQCYRNAFHCSCWEDNQYEYVEGYGAGIIATQHAWVLDTEDGKIFDPTWERDELHSAYYGIVLPKWFVRERVFRSEVYGVLSNDWMFNHEILEHGSKLWEQVSA